MKLNLKARDWHNWISVLLLLPMLLVGMTAIFISHHKSLGINHIEVSGTVSVATELGGTEVYDIVAAPWGITVAAKSGIWVQAEAGWQRMLKGDARNANVAPDGNVTVALNDLGLVTSRDGHNWQVESAILQTLAALPADAVVEERITLGKLVMDLHTGKALLGKSAEWVWIDLLGGIWVFLGFTGLWMWWKSQTKRRDAARAKLMHEASHG